MSLLNSAYSHFEFLSNPETGSETLLAWEGLDHQTPVSISYDIEYPEDATGSKGGKDITAIDFDEMDGLEIVQALEDITGLNIIAELEGEI